MQNSLPGAGVPLEKDDVKEMTKDLVAMFDSLGVVGPNHWLVSNAQNKVENWIGDVVDRVRKGN